MAERALAHIEKIEWVKPIEGADNIELIGVLGWVCIAKKEEFKAGDLAVYIEIDSKCPENDRRFAFLESKHYQVKTMKLGKFKVISQGLALPLALFPELKGEGIGSDVTEKLKIIYTLEEDRKRKSNKKDSNAKYRPMAERNKKLFSKPVIKKLMDTNWGREFLFWVFGRKSDIPKEFPNWIIKTDEERIENAPFYLQSTETWVKTEKLDGTSCTYAVEKAGKNDYEFLVCSRNMVQSEKNKENTQELTIYWELAEKYGIEKILSGFIKEKGYKRIVLQGEGIGNIQGNPYKLDKNDLYIFNFIVDGIRWGTIEMAGFCKQHGLKHVPIVEENCLLPKTMEEMKLEADGYSMVNTKVKREGLVYRSLDGRQSLKNVSREYLLKHS